MKMFLRKWWLAIISISILGLGWACGGDSSDGVSSWLGTKISAGDGYTCAITSDGGAKCWGHNAGGPLGDDSDDDSNTPVDVKGLASGVSSISSDYDHTCALLSSGRVKCWGSNYSGQLGDGTNDNSLTPVDVEGLSGVSSITVGTFTACAITSGGGVKCWGRIGMNGTDVDTNYPVDITGYTFAVSSISLGRGFVCGLLSSGGVKCRGDNSTGQLGDGTKNLSNTPVDVVGLTSGVSSVSSGYSHVCALLSSGGVKCWGDNYLGQLGNGTNINSLTPVEVSGLSSGVTAISVGFNYTCALLSSGKVKCWGRNRQGELGDGTDSDKNTPVDVIGLTSRVSCISAGGGANTKTSHTCAVTSNGGVKCWGNNDFGQLGDGTRTSSSTPVDVLGTE